MGLRKLTDQDLQIEDKKPNETPKPIKEDIEKYNKSFRQENSEIVNKFLNLYDKIYGKVEDFDKFRNVNPSFFEQMDKKVFETQIEDFRTI